jgi:acyl carrier protein
MDRTALRDALRELLEEEKGGTFAPLDEAAVLREELGLDSVDLVSLVMTLQERFRVILTSEDLAGVARVGDLLDMLQGKLQGLPRAA